MSNAASHKINLQKLKVCFYISVTNKKVNRKMKIPFLRVIKTAQ